MTSIQGVDELDGRLNERRAVEVEALTESSAHGQVLHALAKGWRWVFAGVERVYGYKARGRPRIIFERGFSKLRLACMLSALMVAAGAPGG